MLKVNLLQRRDQISINEELKFDQTPTSITNHVTTNIKKKNLQHYLKNLTPLIVEKDITNINLIHFGITAKIKMKNELIW